MIVTNASRLFPLTAAMPSHMAARWFYRDGAGRTYGRPWPEVVEFCRNADLFLHVSASCWMREEYFAARRDFYEEAVRAAVKHPDTRRLS